MAFAIFYNRQDLTPIAAEYSRSSLPQSEKQFAAACWNAGLSGWDTAPLADAAHNGGDPDCRVLVIDGTFKGSPITLQAFREFLIRMSVNPGASYLLTLADDMSRPSGAIEPWP